MTEFLNILSRQYLSQSHHNLASKELLDESQVTNSIQVLTDTFSKLHNMPPNSQQDCVQFMDYVFGLLGNYLNDTVMKKTFQHMIIYEKSCIKCGNRTECQCKYDFVMRLGLTNSVQDSINQFLQPPEIINDFYCDGCDGNGSWKEHNQISALPETLIISLKRFSYVSNICKKQFCNSIINDKLVFNNQTYDLRSIIVHKGEQTSSGHYYCFCSCPIVLQNNDNIMHWYKFDDAKVTSVSKDYVLNTSESMQNNYVLIYHRHDSSVHFRDFISSEEEEEFFLSTCKPFGLHNAINNCYAISVLQSLAFISKSLTTNLPNDYFRKDNLGKIELVMNSINNKGKKKQITQDLNGMTMTLQSLDFDDNVNEKTFFKTEKMKKMVLQQ